MADQRFRAMLINIDKKIDRENELPTLIYYCNIRAKQKELINSTIDLFKILEENQKIKPDNLKYLRQMLKQLELRKDLLLMVDEFESESEDILSLDDDVDMTDDLLRGTSHYNGFVKEKLFLGKYLVGSSWKFFFRSLAIPDEEIDYIEQKYKPDAREQIYKCFQLWLDRERDNASLDIIIKTLQSEDRNDLARKLSAGKYS